MRSLRRTGAGPVPLLASLVLGVALTACRDHTTATLAPAVESRLAAEGIVRRAADQTFRYSFGNGARNAGWEDRRASIVVTHATVLIHKNEKVGIEITPATAERFSVERSGPRVRIRAGQGRSAEIWSFEPPGDAGGWTTDIRHAIRRDAGAPAAPASP